MSITPWSAVIPVAQTAALEGASNSIQLNDGTIIISFNNLLGGAIFFQRFSDTGVAIGGPIATAAINSFSGSQNGSAAHMAALTDGGFAMTWVQGGSILSQEFTAAGAAIGAAIVHELSIKLGDIAAMPSGEYVVSFGQSFQVVQQNGTPFAAVNLGAAVADSDVAVSSSRIGIIRDNNGAFAAIDSFDLNGNNKLFGPVNLTSATTTGSNAIAVLINGGFVGVFEQESSLGGTGVRAIKFMTTKPDGSTLLYGETIIANGLQNVNGLDVKGLANGGFAICYSASPNGLSDQYNSYVKVFNADGSSAGGEFVIQRTDPAFGVFLPEITSLADGRLLVTWTEGNASQTANNVKMQILDPRDGYYVGSANADKIYGHNGNVDHLYGQGGGDMIYGLNGADTIYGDAGIDNLYGGRGDDTVFGGADNDILWGDLGDDEQFGGDGNDIIYSGGGADLMDGGAGTGDAAFYVNELLGAKINLTDQLLTGGSALGDTLFNFERVYGSVRGANDLTGDNNANILVGGQVNDIMRGGGGADVLRGWGGVDTMAGGLNNDIFQYTGNNEGGDIITDFAAGDKFQFTRAAFGNLAGATVAAANYLSVASGHVATTATQRFIFDQATDQLWYDADGNGGVAGVMIADLSTNVNLLNTDLLLA